LARIETADSISVDAHKAFFVPFGTAALLVRDVDELADAHDPDVTGVAYFRDFELGGRDFATVGTELSREPRGPRMWLPLQLLLPDWVRATRRFRLYRALSVVLVLIGLITAAVGLEHWLHLAWWLTSVLTLVIGGLAAAGYVLWNALRSRDIRTRDPNAGRRDLD
jgi:hypothetical protein